MEQALWQAATIRHVNNEVVNPAVGDKLLPVQLIFKITVGQFCVRIYEVTVSH